MQGSWVGQANAGADVVEILMDTKLQAEELAGFTRRNARFAAYVV